MSVTLNAIQDKVKKILLKEYDVQKVESMYLDESFQKKFEVKVKEGKSVSELVSFCRLWLRKLEDNELYLHSYTLTYKANFPMGSELDKSLHQQFISFLSSKAGITDVQLKPTASSRRTESVTEGVIVGGYYTPLKTVFLDGDVFLKDETVKVSGVNYKENYVSIDNKYRLSIDKFKQLFVKA